jgi:hypothetical protein
MKPWTIRQAQDLRNELRKGKPVDYAALAERFGRTQRSIRAMGYRLSMQPLEIEPDVDYGVRCGRCGNGFLWKDTPTDPLVLLQHLKTWETAHRRCKRKA